MKSSTGKYFIALDHVRAVAIFVVFTWHFIHVENGQYAPPPIIPLTFLSEGHTGVALFMVLSGYLFSKLLKGKKINYGLFIRNRILRLAPLLLLIIFLVGVQKYLSGEDVTEFTKSILLGFVTPTLPNGGWSITIEFHFYLLLPLLLFLTRKWKYSLFLAVLLAVSIRVLLFLDLGQMQSISYFTIIGRIDQFLFGMLAYTFNDFLKGKHRLIIFVLALYTLFFWYFDWLGGFYKFPSYPSPSPIWILMPTIEGFVYALIVAWYDTSFTHSTGKISRFIARIGTYSYSIYLWHFFVVFRLSEFINNYILDLSNIYLSMFISGICFLLMIPIGYLSYRYIENSVFEIPQTLYC